MRLSSCRSVLLTTWSAFLLGCGISADEHAKVVGERDSLKTALDELQNGPPRLLAQMRTAVESGKFEDARTLGGQLLSRHASSPEAKEGRQLVEQARLAIETRDVAARRAQADSLREREAQIARALSSMRRSHDDVKEMSWYYDRSVPSTVNSANKLLLYIGKPDKGAPYLRFSIRYVADDWLFIQSYVIKADGRTFEIDASGLRDVERDNGYGGIWEWYDVPAEERELDIVRAIVAAKQVVLRCEGRQYRRDRTIGTDEKLALQRVLNAYEALKRA